MLGAESTTPRTRRASRRNATTRRTSSPKLRLAISCKKRVSVLVGSWPVVVLICGRHSVSMCVRAVCVCSFVCGQAWRCRHGARQSSQDFRRGSGLPLARTRVSAKLGDRTALLSFALRMASGWRRFSTSANLVLLAQDTNAQSPH